MAGTLTRQTILDGTRELVVKAHFVSTGTDETGLVIVNASEYTPAFVNSRLLRADFMATGDFAARLSWDATTPVPLVTIAPNADHEHDWRDFGGLPNNSDVGKTGDILLTTSGIASGDELTIILHLQKEGV